MKNKPFERVVVYTRDTSRHRVNKIVCYLDMKGNYRRVSDRAIIPDKRIIKIEKIC